MAELITERITTNARELKLLGLAETADELVDRAETAKLGYREFLDLVLESEVGVLEGRRYASRLKMSGLPHHKTLDELDTAFQPELDPKRLAELRSLRFIERHVCALILGPPGVGKTHIAVGIAMEALRAGYLVRYTTLEDLVRDLRQADRLGTLRQKLAHYQRPHLLICDEVGYLPLEPADTNRFFQLINRRYTRSSTIVTSNKRVSEWAALLGDEILASAILDRLLHDAEVLTINGPTWRLRGRNEIPNAPASQDTKTTRPTFFDADQPTISTPLDTTGRTGRRQRRRRLWLAGEITDVHRASGGIYGAERVTAKLALRPRHPRGPQRGVGHHATSRAQGRPESPAPTRGAGRCVSLA